MPPVTFFGSLSKTHDVLYSKITDVHETEVYDVRTWNYHYFRKRFRFSLGLHITIVSN